MLADNSVIICLNVLPFESFEIISLNQTTPWIFGMVGRLQVNSSIETNFDLGMMFQEMQSKLIADMSSPFIGWPFCLFEIFGSLLLVFECPSCFNGLKKDNGFTPSIFKNSFAQCSPTKKYSGRVV